MINTFIFKRITALAVSGFLTTTLFFIAGQYYGLFWGIAFFLVGLLLSVVLGSIILLNPFTRMLEGKGVLAINIDSTGILRPFIVSLQSPYIKGKLNKRPINDVWDRETVMQMAAPKKAAAKAIPTEDGGIKIELNELEYNKARFALFHWPVLIYNEQVGSVLTKDFLSTQERDTFAEHGVLFLNRKVEELTHIIRDFGRYVVELTKPKSEWYKNPWLIGFIIFLIIVLAVLFIPPILGNFGVDLSLPVQTIQRATQPVTPA